MPIRINLLAEAQDIEDLRRRDPVKRVVLMGVLLVLAIVVWSSSLFVQKMVAKNELSRLEASVNNFQKEHHQILQNRAALVNGKQRLEALHRLATNRFLVGNLLDALQRTTLPEVQVVRLKLEQTFALTKEIKPKPGATPSTAKPATSKETIVLTLAAKDKSSTPGEGVSKYQALLAAEPYFRDWLGKTNSFRLVSLGAIQNDTDGKPFVLMGLEGKPPEITR